MPYIEMKHSYKRYKTGDTEIIANNDINFEINKGELVIILGASGAGKSTVLNILGGMDNNDEGQIIIDGEDIADYNHKQLTTYRRNDVGFVFQFYNLVPNLTAKENVELAVEIVPDALDPIEVLTEVGLGRRLNNFPAQLSGGEQQRVAIARSLASNVDIIFADEPTGNLDQELENEIIDVFKDLAHHHNKCVIMVTHSKEIAEMSDVSYQLRKGVLSHNE